MLNFPMMAGGLFLEPCFGTDSHKHGFNAVILHSQHSVPHVSFSTAFNFFTGGGISEWKFPFFEEDGTGFSKYLDLRTPEKHHFECCCFKTNKLLQGRIIPDFKSFVSSWLVPEGYPDSVIPSYGPYMQWRALQHFFGGAIGVFTTQSLLHALGVSSRGTNSLAINWVIKDGAGRIGKLLFARKGRKFDCDLKQLRFAGHILMEVGALVELATSIAPSLFLPLACVANVVKNIAAVSSTSTRTPIYKAFAIRENIGDITAKGECTSNIADLLGTGLGITISRGNKHILPIFVLLSCGYVFSSYWEVKSVTLPTLNQARFAVAVQHFLKTGQVQSISEVNKEERIFMFPWAQHIQIELGAVVADAFQDSREFLATKAMFKEKKYLVTYNERKKRAYVVLKEAATSEDVMEGAFQAHMLLHILHRSHSGSKLNVNDNSHDPVLFMMDDGLITREAVGTAILTICKESHAYYEAFKEKVAAQGWIISESLLNPGGARLCTS